jgi:hypothetical protein
MDEEVFFPDVFFGRFDQPPTADVAPDCAIVASEVLADQLYPDAG